VKTFNDSNATFRFLLIAAVFIGLFSISALAEPWSFGVMGDTQSPFNNSENPSYVAKAVIDQLNAQFIAKDVKFVIQVGDQINAGGNLQARVDAAQALYNAGIEFFPLRGNHDPYDLAGRLALSYYFPQTQGLSNVYNVVNFSSPVVANNELAGLSYSFDYISDGGSARFVIIDDQMTPLQNNSIVPGYPYGYTLALQTSWVDERLDKGTRGTEHAFVFGHRNMIPENHADTIFGGYLNLTLDFQNTFLANLQNNDVKFYISGHEHLYNRAVISSPDSQSKVQELIIGAAGPKFINPLGPSSANYLPYYDGQKVRQTQITQELNNIGFYIFTVDGPRVTVDYYADATGSFVPPGWPAAGQATPTFNFVKKETWGYSLNGQEFLIAQGQPYTSVVDGFEGTVAQIIDGVNGSTKVDSTIENRPLTKAVNTGWTPNTDGSLNSNILTIWGMAELGTDQTDTYVLSMTYDQRKTTHIGNGGFGIAAKDEDGKWINAVDMNFGDPSKAFVKGPWKPGYALGTYGVDPSSKTVWAVLNYNADFAVYRDIEPVPGHRK
jgi:hypothetical protein